MDAVTQGMQHYFEMHDLVEKTGQYIARLLETEAATIVSCASAGIAQSVAAVLVKDDDWLLTHLHETPLTDNEIVLPKGHNVNFGAPVGAMVALGAAGWWKRVTPTNAAPANLLPPLHRTPPRCCTSNLTTVCRKVC